MQAHGRFCEIASMYSQICECNVSHEAINECLLCRVMVAFAKLRVQSYYYFLNYTNIFDIFFQKMGKT